MSESKGVLKNKWMWVGQNNVASKLKELSMNNLIQVQQKKYIMIILDFISENKKLPMSLFCYR